MSAPDTIERVDFAVVYDGPALDDGRMSVRDLAPALLGFADLLQAANESLNPGQAAPSLNIKATSEGSFIVELALLNQQVIDLLNTREAIGLTALVGIITGSFGVLAYFRRPPGDAEELPDGAVRITMVDGTRVEFSAQVLGLARQVAIRRATNAVVSPLRRDGIDRMEVRPSPKEPATVALTKDDLVSVDAALGDEVRNLVTDQRYTALLTITSPNFASGKWRLSDGQQTHWMAIDDPVFLGRINAHEVRFGKDDRLRGEVRFRQWITDSGAVHAERSVTRVDEFIPASVATQTTIEDHLTSRDSG
ncbi:MAG TPA: hypothetical protein VME70_08985 [Mycobacteriales bacterium]|nr:hypothetical protein [Mycobacteriales bacterium]